MEAGYQKGGEKYIKKNMCTNTEEGEKREIELIFPKPCKPLIIRHLIVKVLSFSLFVQDVGTTSNHILVLWFVFLFFYIFLSLILLECNFVILTCCPHRQ